MCWLDAFHFHFHQQPMEKKIAFKDKRKVEFSIYGDTTLHSMLHAEKKKKFVWQDGVEEKESFLCLKPGVKLYGIFMD